jgi:carbon monoxide dehydrogenase subunit G
MFTEKGEYHLSYPKNTVFAYMKKPENAAKVAPSLSNSRGLDKEINGRPVVRAEYDIQNLIDGEVDLHPTRFEEGSHIRYEMYDKFNGYVDWYFYSEDKGTLFEYEAKVDINLPIPSFVVNKITSLLANRELDSIIDNMREELDDFEK